MFEFCLKEKDKFSIFFGKLINEIWHLAKVQENKFRSSLWESELFFFDKNLNHDILKNKSVDAVEVHIQDLTLSTLSLVEGIWCPICLWRTDQMNPEMRISEANKTRTDNADSSNEVGKNKHFEGSCELLSKQCNVTLYEDRCPELPTPVRMTPCPLKLKHQTSWTGAILKEKMAFSEDKC